MHTSTYLYSLDNETFQGFLAYDDKIDQPRPAVLVAHDWSGCNEFAREKAKKLAQMGYVGFAIDLYGMGRTGQTNEEKIALMEPLSKNRLLLRARMNAAYTTLIAMTEVDSKKVAAIGYCFGGMAVLDLARSGAALQSVVSFHGLLNKPTDLPNAPILAKILALHGYNDPMVRPEQVLGFCQEMTDEKVDWQLHMYGNTVHGFSNPEANNPQFGTVYSPDADHRSWLSMSNFLSETLGV